VNVSTLFTLGEQEKGADVRAEEEVVIAEDCVEEG